jgi:hypothetical protein
MAIAAGSLRVTADRATTPRTLAARWADVVNVLDFGAAGDGATDDLAAFRAAEAAIPPHARGTIFVPGRHIYYLGGFLAETGGRTIEVKADIGAAFTGPGGIYVTRFDRATSDIGPWATDIQSAAGGQIGPQLDVVNNGRIAGIGRRFNYLALGASTGGGGDIADYNINQWDGLNGAQAFGRWDVAISPVATMAGTAAWGLVNSEMNPVNRGPDRGWTPTRGQNQTWTGALQIVPDIGAAAGSRGTNVLFGVFFGNGVSPNVAGVVPKLHNAILVEPDTVTADGYFAYVAGASTAGDAAVSPLTFPGHWQRGVRCDLATITSAACLDLAPGQVARWSNGAGAATIGGTGAGADLSVVVTPSGAGVISLAGPTILGGHVIGGGAAPAVSVGTLDPASSDTRGAVTLPGGVTSVGLTFAAPYAAAPFCMLTGSSTTDEKAVTAISATAMTIGLSANAAGETVYWHCMQ